MIWKCQSFFFLSLPCNYQTLLYHCFIVIAFLIKEYTCGFNTCNMSSKIHQHYLIVHKQVKKVMHVCLQGWCFVMTASISLYKVFFGQLSGTILFVKNAWLCLICLRSNLLNHCYMGCQNYYIVCVQRRTISNLNPMASQTMFRLFFMIT